VAALFLGFLGIDVIHFSVFNLSWAKVFWACYELLTFR